jgi:Zn-dependent protease
MADEAFRLFGFPVSVRPGFLVFLLLIVVINGPELGVWLAVFMGGFTLLHELGHAVAARATGATASIALEFFYGYASFVPSRRLARWEQAGISFAGPAVQIAAGTVVLLAAGINPLDIDQAVRDAEHWQMALWWAGPVIGAFNLIPLLPFDGGNIVFVAIERLLGRRARAVMAWGSLAVTAGVLAVMALKPELQPFVLFAIFPLIAQLQMVGSLRGVRQHTLSTVPSPWELAHRDLANGNRERAAAILLRSFHDRRGGWALPDDASPQQLEALLGLLPRPLPVGSPYAGYAAADVLLRLGEYTEAAHYAAAVHAREPHPLLAVQVARAAAALGDQPTALGWLRNAGLPNVDPAVARAISAAPELAPLFGAPR